MPTASAFEAILELGDPELWTDAARSAGAVPPPRVNAHIHLPPNFSAFESVAHAVDLAAGQGLQVLGASNYYDYGVYAEFAGRARTAGLFPLFGLEVICTVEDLRQAGLKINDPGNPGRMYLCGKGITAFESPGGAARRLLETMRRNDTARMARMVGKLEARFGTQGVPTGLDAAAVVERVVRRHGCSRESVCLQERHVCQAFQEVFFERVGEAERLERLGAILGAAPRLKSPTDAVGVQNEIRAQLLKAGKPAFVEERFLSFEEARELILGLGGLPCYPTLADGTAPICPFEEPVERWVARLQERGLCAAELIPIRNAPEVLARYVRALRAAGIVVTGGTEHNTLDLIPLLPACKGGVPVPEEIQELFWEGACVVAAHQSLRLWDRPGFVDERGSPHPGFPSTEARIRAFAALGERIIGRYRSRYAPV